MCKRRNTTKTEVSRGTFIRADNCLSKVLEKLNGLWCFETLGSCCGHGKYTMSLVIREWVRGRPGHWEYYDLVSGVSIPRKKRFYVKDKNGYYYIPEVEEYWKKQEKTQRRKKMVQFKW